MTRQLDLTGLAVALATPFRAGGELDLASLRRLVRHVAAGGARTLVPLGTTGEAPTLDEADRDAVVETVLAAADGLSVVVGAGSSSTRQAARWARRAQELGAHGALVVTPPYNKPTADGLVAHYAAIAEGARGLPLVAYNVPGRSGVNLTPAILARLWENAQVVAVKESSGSLAQIGEIARTLPAGKQLLAGDDSLALPAIACGACGVVSVVGNLVPREMAALVAAALAGRCAEARQLHFRLLPLMDTLFLESSPIPLKTALALLDLGGDEPRLPLVRASSETRRRLEAALATAVAEEVPS